MREQMRERLARCLVGVPEAIARPILEDFDRPATPEELTQHSRDVEALPPDTRAAYVMRYVLALSPAEVTRRLRITPEELEARIVHAFLLLRDAQA